MSHPTPETLLALRDGALTVAARRDVQEHLDGCLDCRSRLNDLAESSGPASLEAVPRQPAPVGGRETFYESFTRRVDARVQGGEWALESEAGRSKGPSAAHRLILGGVVVAAVLVGMTMVVQPRLSIEDLASRMLKLNAEGKGSPTHAADATVPVVVTPAPATVAKAPEVPKAALEAVAIAPAPAAAPRAAEQHARVETPVAALPLSTPEAAPSAAIVPTGSAPGAPAVTPPELATAAPTTVAPPVQSVVYASSARIDELVERARKLSAVAERRSRAEHHDAAAVAWERVRDVARPSNPVRVQATDRAADERYSAWAHQRNSVRELAARRALTVAMTTTPKGPERDHLNELLKMVRTAPKQP